MKRLYEKHEVVFAFSLFMVLNICSILRMGDSVGLYLDAVNPDYLATKMVYPNPFTGSLTLPYIGVPLLGQAYHGTVTMFGSLLSILITGTTSVLQLRITNGFYAALSAAVIYKILRYEKVGPKFSLAICILLCISPNYTATFFTQYYIELPGIFFLLMHIYYMLVWKNDLENRHLLYAGIFGGLAVYDYFNFLFFVPAALMMMFMISMNRKTGRHIENLFTLLAGYAMGVVPYIIGYMELLFCMTEAVSLKIKLLIMFLSFVALLAVLIYVYRLQAVKSFKNRIISVVLLCLGMTGVLLLGIATLDKCAGYFQALHVEGTAAGFGARLQYLWTFLKEVTCQSAIEYLVIGQRSSVGMWLVPLLTVLLSGMAFCFAGLKKDREADDRIHLLGTVYFYFIIYLICCIVMATRMQGQHFICIVFLMYLALGLSSSLVYDHMLAMGRGPAACRTGILFYGAVMLMLFYNQTAIIYKTRNINGSISSYNPYYSNAVQNLAEKAIEEKDMGEKQFYVFPEWGIMCGFDYLTFNGIAFSGDMNPKILKLMSQTNGYDIVVCYWDDQYTESYKSQLLQLFSEDKMTLGVVPGNYANILEIRVKR